MIFKIVEEYLMTWYSACDIKLLSEFSDIFDEEIAEDNNNLKDDISKNLNELRVSILLKKKLTIV